MKRVIGMDIHRTFAEVVIWEAGQLRPAGRVDMSRAGLEGFGRTLSKEEDEVVIEATGNAMAVVRALEPHVARVIVANPTQVVGAGPKSVVFCRRIRARHSRGIGGAMDVAARVMLATATMCTSPRS